jgi:hypothetical protein
LVGLKLQFGIDGVLALNIHQLPSTVNIKKGWFQGIPTFNQHRAVYLVLLRWSGSLLAFDLTA